MCTLSYVHAYTHLYTSWYMYVPTRSAYGEVDPFCDIDHEVHIYYRYIPNLDPYEEILSHI